MISMLRREDGTALVTAVLLTGVMAMLGLAVHAAADTQSRQSGQERVRESALGVTEAALNAQVFQLARNFPHSTTPYPASCAPGSPAGVACPDPSNFQGYQGDDYAATCNGTTVVRYTTTVRDNELLADGSPNPYYSAAVIDAKPSYDANKDGVVWVRSDGRAGCRTRSVVTQVRAGAEAIAFPRNVITANSFSTTNNGRKVIVDTRGNAGEAADVSLRCTGYTGTDPHANGCATYEEDKGQVEPDTLRAPAASPSPLIDGAELESIRALARSKGTYFGVGACPTSLTGEVVYVETLASTCNVSRAGNSAANPGFLVVGNGTFDIGGNLEFYGTIYMRNEQNSSGPVVSLGGTSAIFGSVAIDGRGSVAAGSSKANVIYDSRSASLVKGLGSAAAVPNTWRELPVGQ